MPDDFDFDAGEVFRDDVSDSSNVDRSQYWDVPLGIWSTEGCVASPPPSARPDGFLHCNCTHLTDFGGVSFPTSAEEFLDELTSIQFTTFTMDECAHSQHAP